MVVLGQNSTIWKFVAGVPDRSGGVVGDPARNGNLIDTDVVVPP